VDRSSVGKSSLLRPLEEEEDSEDEEEEVELGPKYLFDLLPVWGFETIHFGSGSYSYFFLEIFARFRLFFRSQCIN